jgi:hypothetical protein
MVKRIEEGLARAAVAGIGPGRLAIALVAAHGSRRRAVTTGPMRLLLFSSSSAVVAFVAR